MIFVIVSKDMLSTPIPQDVIEHLGYSGNPTLIEKVLVCSELEDGTFAISVNLKADGKECAWTTLSATELKLAEIMYGEDNLLTQGEYKQLSFKSESI